MTRRTKLPLAGTLDVGRLQVIPKRDVDAALEHSKDLARKVEDLEKRCAELESQNTIMGVRVACLEKVEARLARIEKRLDERH